MLKSKSRGLLDAWLARRSEDMKNELGTPHSFFYAADGVESSITLLIKSKAEAHLEDFQGRTALDVT